MKNNSQFTTDSSERGFGITELVVATAISTIIIIAVTGFARDMIRLNISAQSGLTASFETRNVLRVMVAELRSAIPSAQGSYPIASAGTSSIVFFADADGDKVADRVRYFYDAPSASVKRGLTLATGTPPVYNLGSEVFSILVSGVLNDSSLPLFEYHNGNYAGTSTPMALPIDITAVRLIKVNITVNRDPDRVPPELMTVSSQATLRNLKDNI